MTTLDACCTTDQPPRYADGVDVGLVKEDVPIFQVGEFPDPTPEDPERKFVVTPEDAERYASNLNRLYETGQRVPVVEEHDTPEGGDQSRFAVGWLGRAKLVGNKVLADVTNLTREMFDNWGRLLGRSVEITDDPASFNYRGVDGSIIKRLALLTKNLPRIKTLDSSVYAEVPAWCLRGVPGSRRALSVCFAETNAMSDVTAGASPGVTLSLDAILQMVADDPTLAEKLKAALSGGSGGQAAAEPTPEEKAKAEENAKSDAMQMSELRKQNETLAAKVEILAGSFAEAEKARKIEAEKVVTTSFAELEHQLSLDYGPAPGANLAKIVRNETSAKFSELGSAGIRKFADDTATSLGMRKVARSATAVTTGAPITTIEQARADLVNNPNRNPRTADFFARNPQFAENVAKAKLRKVALNG